MLLASDIYIYTTAGECFSSREEQGTESPSLVSCFGETLIYHRALLVAALSRCCSDWLKISL